MVAFSRSMVDVALVSDESGRREANFSNICTLTLQYIFLFLHRLPRVLGVRYQLIQKLGQNLGCVPISNAFKLKAVISISQYDFTFFSMTKMVDLNLDDERWIMGGPAG